MLICQRSISIKILYDLSYLEKEKIGGISNMWAEYLKKIQSNQDLIFLTKKKVDNIVHNELRHTNFYGHKIIEQFDFVNTTLKKISMLNILSNFNLLVKIPNDVDIFHSTGYGNPLIKRKKLKIVTTIHDMVFWDQKDHFIKNISYWDNIWGIYHSLRISDKVISVSNTTKKSIVKHFPWSEDKIVVIYHGLSKEFLNIDIKKNKEKFFMFMGGRNQYKNFDLLLRSFASFVKANPEWRLYVVGQNNHTSQQEIKRYKTLGILKKVKDFGLVQQNVIIELLKKTSAVVIPSLNEGFNFPLLEGMACGAPVLCSKIPVSKEIGKNYVQYFDNNEKSLLHLMNNISKQGINFDNLKKAQDYSRTFIWDNSYNELMKVYESCI